MKPKKHTARGERNEELDNEPRIPASAEIPQSVSVAIDDLAARGHRTRAAQIRLVCIDWYLAEVAS